MLNEHVIVKTNNIGEVIRGFDHNFMVFSDHINNNCEAIDNLTKDVAKLMKKTRFKASKLSVFLLAAAGIAYAVKNESEKQDLKFQLLEMDKRIRFNNECYTATDTD